MCNRFIVLEVYQQSKDLLKHVDKKVESLMGQTESKKINLHESSHGQEMEPMLYSKPRY